ncbi:hypothetical protein NPX13_g3935 [Xylaria arbuscula]|uniref:Reverse transcriptase domain-containing protein n=1 Tax=Xylaria arbuscula TaxID=114810 RepID=A0A9W8NHI7_9PEZI|nr:hypothetical protein NPX13_g3935 [Xylaria arbuscula]
MVVLKKRWEDDYKDRPLPNVTVEAVINQQPALTMLQRRKRFYANEVDKQIPDTHDTQGTQPAAKRRKGKGRNTKPPPSWHKDTPRDELDQYLADPMINISIYLNDPVAWWRDIGAKRFPRLCYMAVDFLTIPSAQAETERQFSSMGEMISARRSRLMCHVVGARIEIIRDRPQRKIWLSQTSYIKKIDLGISGFKRKGARVTAHQQRLFPTRDLLWITINGIPHINFYRAPDTAPVFDYITSLVPRGKLIIGGDINATVSTYEPGARNRAGGQVLADWSGESGMAFTGVPGQAKRRGGHVIDMVFSNIAYVDTVVDHTLASGSDHFPLLSWVPLEVRSARHERFRVKILPGDEERFQSILATGMASIAPLTDSSTAKDTEAFADRVAAVFTAAVNTAGTQVRDGATPSKWWNKECKQAAKDYREAEAEGFRLGRIELGYSAEHRHFLAVVRKAKKDYWRRIIDNANTDAALYKVVAWHKKESGLQPPPLIHEGRVVEDELGKAELLRQAVLNRFDSRDDLAGNPLEGWRSYEATLPWNTSTTLEEVEAHTIGVSSTSPGPDGITVDLLRLGWEASKGCILTLFQRCLQLGYFPQRWRHAEVAMIPKVGKKDMSSVRSWRPIALLSCLGKGFERLVAKRIAWIALQRGVLSPQHGGALPKRSTMDLVCALLHDVEIALSKGYVVTLLTMDVQGAFDALLKRRLLYRMRQQGWPLPLLRLIDSFLCDRAIRVRLGRSTTTDYAVSCGTPQGSPLSPVLYMLYLAELLKLDTERRFGYADDIGFYRISKSAEENIELLTGDVMQILAWGDENKVHFAPEKCEMIHITRGLSTANPPLEIPNRLRVEPVPLPTKGVKAPALRWLGVWFDRKLTFKRHVNERTSKALKLAWHLKHLANTKYGPPADMIRKAVITCVVPTALYGSEAWYAGRTKPRARAAANDHSEVRAGVGRFIEKIDYAFTVGGRATLPVWRTTPNRVVMRDAGLPTAEVALEQALYRQAWRLRTVDSKHPLAARQKLAYTKRAPTRETRSALYPKCR